MKNCLAGEWNILKLKFKIKLIRLREKKYDVIWGVKNGGDRRGLGDVKLCIRQMDLKEYKKGLTKHLIKVGGNGQ